MTIKNAVDAQEFSENRFTKNPLFQKGKTTAFVLNFFPGQTLRAASASELSRISLCNRR